MKKGKSDSSLMENTTGNKNIIKKPDVQQPAKPLNVFPSSPQMMQEINQLYISKETNITSPVVFGNGMKYIKMLGESTPLNATATLYDFYGKKLGTFAELQQNSTIYCNNNLNTGCFARITKTIKKTKEQNTEGQNTEGQNTEGQNTEKQNTKGQNTIDQKTKQQDTKEQTKKVTLFDVYINMAEAISSKATGNKNMNPYELPPYNSSIPIFQYSIPELLNSVIFSRVYGEGRQTKAFKLLSVVPSAEAPVNQSLEDVQTAEVVTPVNQSDIDNLPKASAIVVANPIKSLKSPKPIYEIKTTNVLNGQTSINDYYKVFFKQNGKIQDFKQLISDYREHYINEYADKYKNELIATYDKWRLFTSYKPPTELIEQEQKKFKENIKKNYLPTFRNTDEIFSKFFGNFNFYAMQTKKEIENNKYKGQKTKQKFWYPAQMYRLGSNIMHQFTGNTVFYTENNSIKNVELRTNIYHLYTSEHNVLTKVECGTMDELYYNTWDQNVIQYDSVLRKNIRNMRMRMGLNSEFIIVFNGTRKSLNTISAVNKVLPFHIIDETNIGIPFIYIEKPKPTYNINKATLWSNTGKRGGITSRKRSSSAQFRRKTQKRKTRKSRK